MADYISRKAAVAIAEKYGLGRGCILGSHSGVADCIASEIESIPAADVEPVRYGVWENTSKMYEVYSGRCSVCKLDSGMWHINQPYQFCPFCGARLKLEGENDY